MRLRESVPLGEGKPGGVNTACHAPSIGAQLQDFPPIWGTSCSSRQMSFTLTERKHLGTRAFHGPSSQALAEPAKTSPSLSIKLVTSAAVLKVLNM